MVDVRLRVMTLGATNPGGISRIGDSSGDERAALEGMLRGYPVGEVGSQTFPRNFGSGSATSMKNILATIKDIRRTRREIFSDSYDLPEGRERQ